MNANALLIRAFKTFLQTFLGVLSLNVLTITNIETGKVALGAALAAGISATMNIFIKPNEG